jgi:hypothetical protein
VAWSTSCSRNLLEPARNRLVFRHLASSKRISLKKSILTETTGTSSSIGGTYSPRGPNTTSAFRNLLEPARNLFCANAWPWPNTIFFKLQVSWSLLEPVGTCAEPIPCVGQTRLQLLGTYWNLLGTYSVLHTWPQPNANFSKMHSDGTYWNLAGTLIF